MAEEDLKRHDAETGTRAAAYDHPKPEYREEPRKDTEEEASVFSSMLAIIGLVILVVVVVWGLIHLASLSSSWFDSLLPHSTPSIELEAPASTASRTPITLRWRYTSSESGSYSFVYQCGTGAHFETATSKQIPCGAAYALASSTSLALTPVLSDSASSTIPYSVVFIPSGTSAPSAQASGSLLVTPAVAAAQTITTTQSVPAAKKPQGPADLSVRIISVSADQYGNGTAIFDIANVGSGSSGAYYFQSILPTTNYGTVYYYGSASQGYSYSSPAQVSLAPGEHVVSTLRFTGAEVGGVFSVTADPSSSITDSNRTNNYAYQTLVGNYNTYNNSQPYYYQYNYQQPQPYYYTY